MTKFVVINEEGKLAVSLVKWGDSVVQDLVSGNYTPEAIFLINNNNSVAFISFSKVKDDPNIFEFNPNLPVSEELNMALRVTIMHMAIKAAKLPEDLTSHLMALMIMTLTEEKPWTFFS